MESPYVEELKAEGNKAFQEGRYKDAIDYFTRAIDSKSDYHVLYSNRSAAYASLNNHQAALEDAEKVIELKPDWPKGYSRLGVALHRLGRFEEALEAYTKGLELDPNNQALKEGKEKVEEDMNKPQNPFGSSDIFSKLLNDPRTCPLMAQPDFVQMLKDLQTSPQNMMKHMNDPRMQLLMEVALGINLSTSTGEAGASESAKEAKEETQLEEEVTEEKPPEPPAEEDKATNAAKEESLKEKEAGNAAYKKKKFDEAIEHYTKAIELYDGDITYLTNRAAVHLEKGDYDKCISDCEEAIKKGAEIRADYKVVAKAMARKGKALIKLGKHEEAIDIFNQSLTEHRSADTLNALREAEKYLKEQKEKEYVDLDQSAKEKEAGNEAFKQQKYPEAVKHYTEALKRGPPEANPEAYKLFSNRAACYTKLCAWYDGLKDAEKCIELKPDFGKGYSRKANIQFFMRDYEKAMETYKQGLEMDPDNQEMKEGIQSCLNQISRIAKGEASEVEMAERRNRAMADPEIQQILTDPVMAQVLKDFESDPKSAQQHLKNPQIMNKLNRLITAGIIKVQ